jgi:hypothetical protein
VRAHWSENRTCAKGIGNQDGGRGEGGGGQRGADIGWNLGEGALAGVALVEARNVDAAVHAVRRRARRAAVGVHGLAV